MRPNPRWENLGKHPSKFPKSRRIGIDPPLERKPRAALIVNYKEPLARLRKLGIDPMPGVSLDRIKSVAQIPKQKRAAITRLYSNYDYLFSRPHIVADFSLPEETLRRKFSTWKVKIAATLKRDGYSKKEIAKAIKDAGGYEEHKRRELSLNDQRKIAAQNFAGQIPDKNLKAAIIPVITGYPQKVRLKFNKDGTPFLREKYVDTFDIKFDPSRLVRGGRKYLESLLAPYGERDRFLVITGDHMTVKNSGAKTRMIEHILRFMGKYAQKAIIKGKDKGRANPHYWKNWLLGIRVITPREGGDETDVESARQSFDALRVRMKKERKAEYDKLNAGKQAKIKEQNRTRQARKRVRDNFID